MVLNRRFLVVIACSLAWALIMATVFYRIAAKSVHGGKALPSKRVVVAAQALPLGAVISKDAVKTIEIPENLFPKGGFSLPDQVLDRPVVSPIEVDEPIVEARIGAKGSGVGLAPMIPPGLRALSVRVNDVVGVAGFVLPGMKVDVLVTGRPPSRGDDTVTTTVLQNILVLSAGQTIQTDAKGQPISATVVTLLVDPSQAEALTLANNEGHIQMVLRNSTDQKIASTNGRHLRELYGIEGERQADSRPAEPVPVRQKRTTPPVPGVVPTRQPVVQAPAAAPQRTDEVLMIRGNQKILETAPHKLGN